MNVVVVLNQKGGAGKTTIAVGVAASYAKEGKRILLIDADATQGSASTWAAINEGRYFDTVTVEPHQIKAFLQRNTDNYDFVVIDCPPRADKDAGKFISVATLVLIPVQPSPYDVWACDDLISIIQTRKEATAGIPDTPDEGLPLARFVLSRAQKGARLTTEVTQALLETNIKVLNACTTQFEAYKRSAMTGHTIFDAPEQNKEAQQQIHDIATEIGETIYA